MEQNRKTIKRAVCCAAAFVLILVVSLSLMIRAQNYREEKDAYAWEMLARAADSSAV